MPKRTPPTGWQRQILGIAGLLAVTLIGAAGMRLVGQISQLAISQNPLSCTSVGSPFQGMRDLKPMADAFRTEVSAVVDERVNLLSGGGETQCSAAAGDAPVPPMPKLEALAKKLPGWSYEMTRYKTYTQKGVDFDSFTPVLYELLRVYECRLDEVIDSMSSRLHDQLMATGEGQSMSESEFLQRIAYEQELARQDGARARTALDRTMNALRGFALDYPLQQRFSCASLALLDLRNGLGLLADASSCMPRVWDAHTSLHDRSDFLISSGQTPSPPTNSTSMLQAVPPLNFTQPGGGVNQQPGLNLLQALPPVNVNQGGGGGQPPVNINQGVQPIMNGPQGGAGGQLPPINLLQGVQPVNANPGGGAGQLQNPPLNYVQPGPTLQISPPPTATTPPPAGIYVDPGVQLQLPNDPNLTLPPE